MKSETYGTSQKAKTQFDCKSNSEILSKHFVLQGLRIVLPNGNLSTLLLGKNPASGMKFGKSLDKSLKIVIDEM